jgi:hypothetical protein
MSEEKEVKFEIIIELLNKILIQLKRTKTK